MQKYPTVFHLLHEVSNKTGISPVLVGGFAVNHYKVSRHTADVDFLITDQDFEKIIDLLKDAGYRLNTKQELCARLSTPDQEYLIDIDFIFSDKETIDQLVKQGEKTNLYGQEFIVPSLNHLLAMKIHSIKQNPGRRQNRDLMDVVDLTDKNNIEINGKEFKELCLKFGSKNVYNKILTLKNS
jgi:predicted nucleotidyltransferase component of viral defense system